MSDTIESIIREEFFAELKEQGVELQDRDTLDAETVLLETGLDSLGFATLVIRLEERLGYDPFQIVEEPVYPETFAEFVAMYEQFSEYAHDE